MAVSTAGNIRKISKRMFIEITKKIQKENKKYIY